MDMNHVSKEDMVEIFKKNVDVLLIVDAKEDIYRTVICKGIFTDFIEETGKYNELIENLWFHFNGTQEKITEEYRVFLPVFGEFQGKFSKKLKLYVEEDDKVHIAQMMVYPLEEDRYMFIMDDLDNSEYVQEFMTNDKVNTIQNTYLFSMYIDLGQNAISSLSITEISDEEVHSTMSYTDWRMMIVNMIGKDDQEQFLTWTDPEFLKGKFAPGRTSSFDCLMQNLEGKFIWVKLIFSRVDTSNEEDYRFVFMVQNIHENSVELMSELKKYEEMASKDSLTNVYNHGRIETEMNNAVDACKKKGQKASAMILDIDHFKKINDTYGHAVGDEVLKQFAKTILKTVSGENAVVGRWGGEEFVVVCYDKNSEEMVAIAEGLRLKVESSKFDTADRVTCSIGVTELRGNDTTDEAFDRMDRAMYTAKSKGRNGVRCL